MRSRFFLAYYFLAFGLFASAAHAGAYRLNDGQFLTGDPISYNEAGLIVRQSDGNVSSRTPWSQFSQEALKQLMADAKNAKDKSYIEPFVEEIVEKEAKRKEIVVKTVEPPARPTGSLGIFAGFSSPVFIVIFLLIYVGNLYAAYEIAFFKNQPPAVVCGLAAVVPWIGPVIFLCIPGKPDPMHGELYDQIEPTAAEQPIPEVKVNATPAPIAPAPGVAAPVYPAASVISHPGMKISHPEPALQPVTVIPEPVTYRRGEFSFNRRFFETKLAGFFRVVPAESEKDLVIVMKTARGEFIGKRVTRVTQAELYLQVIKEGASHDEMIPFTEVQEVTVRHKDAV